MTKSFEDFVSAHGSWDTRTSCIPVEESEDSWYCIVYCVFNVENFQVLQANNLKPANGDEFKGMDWDGVLTYS